jgi:siroheme synthase
MGIKTRGLIAQALIEAGRSPETPVAFIENATTPRERVVISTLGQAGTVPVEAPALFVIGDVVAKRAELLALARWSVAAA